VLTAAAGVAGALAAGVLGVDAAGAGVEAAGVWVEIVAAGAGAGVAAGAASVTALAAPAAEPAAPLALWATDCVVVATVPEAIAAEVPAALALDRPKTHQIANTRIAPTKPANTADERVPKRVIASAEYPGRLHNDRKLQDPTYPPASSTSVEIAPDWKISNRSLAKRNQAGIPNRASSRWHILQLNSKAG
jgi:hypothetical protein